MSVKISDLPTPIAVLADDDRIPASDASDLTADAYVTPPVIRASVLQRSFIRAIVARTLANVATEQAIFNDPANGRVTLPVGTYRVFGALSLSSMSATSGNAAVDLLGAGTAVCDSWLWQAWGRDNSSTTAAAAVTGSFTISQQSVASIATAGTGTALQISIEGTFEVTTAGTLIPSVTLVTAAAAVLGVGSWLCFERLGAVDVISLGAWD